MWVKGTVWAVIGFVVFTLIASTVAFRFLHNPKEELQGIDIEPYRVDGTIKADRCYFHFEDSSVYTVTSVKFSSATPYYPITVYCNGIIVAQAIKRLDGSWNWYVTDEAAAWKAAKYVLESVTEIEIKRKDKP
jgi:hypothetical protein